MEESGGVVAVLWSSKRRRQYLICTRPILRGCRRGVIEDFDHLNRIFFKRDKKFVLLIIDDSDGFRKTHRLFNAEAPNGVSNVRINVSSDSQVPSPHWEAFDLNLLSFIQQRRHHREVQINADGDEFWIIHKSNSLPSSAARPPLLPREFPDVEVFEVEGVAVVLEFEESFAGEGLAGFPVVVERGVVDDQFADTIRSIKPPRKQTVKGQYGNTSPQYIQIKGIKW